MKKTAWMLSAILLALGFSALALEVEETWHCFESNDFNRELAVAVLVKERAQSGAVIGTVTLDGVAYDSEFSMTGTQRRWDFAGGRHAIILADDGAAHFFDFAAKQSGRPVEASRSFRCNRI